MDRRAPLVIVGLYVLLILPFYVGAAALPVVIGACLIGSIAFLTLEARRHLRR